MNSDLTFLYVDKDLGTVPSFDIERSGSVQLLTGLPIAAVPARNHSGGLIVTAAVFWIVFSELIVGLAAKFRLPAIYWNDSHVRGGGLMSYGPDSPALDRASADYVDRILKGAKPENLPVQAPNQTDLKINLKTAAALGITIPQSVLLQAKEVIR